MNKQTRSTPFGLAPPSLWRGGRGGAWVLVGFVPSCTAGAITAINGDGFSKGFDKVADFTFATVVKAVDFADDHGEMIDQCRYQPRDR